MIDVLALQRGKCYLYTTNELRYRESGFRRYCGYFIGVKTRKSKLVLVFRCGAHTHSDNNTVEPFINNSYHREITSIEEVQPDDVVGVGFYEKGWWQFTYRKKGDEKV